jgi:hypothetical protein
MKTIHRKLDGERLINFFDLCPVHQNFKSVCKRSVPLRVKDRRQRFLHSAARAFLMSIIQFACSEKAGLFKFLVWL